MKDQHSIALLKTLHPKTRGDFEDFINAAEDELKITIRIVQGFRTFDEQAKIYAQGRTTPGKIVTWAPPGFSWHCYGLAIDIVPFTADGKNLDWNYDFQHLGAISGEYGLDWGGDFPKGKKDYDHFENKFTLDIHDAYHRYTIKDFIPGTQFINI